MNNIIEIKNLSFSYKKNKSILKNISTEIEKNKITSIIGRNACGKSTLLEIIAASKNNFTGQILIDKKNIKDFSKKELAKKISLVFQKNIAPSQLSVYETVSYGRLTHKKNIFSQNTKIDLEKINRALMATDLIDLKDELVENLSGGQIQRVFIAMALAQDTEILLLDEPTSYLDIKYQKEIMKLIKKLNKEYEKTIVMVLHDINQALKYSDNIIAIADGKVVKNDKASNFYDENFLSELYGLEINISEKEKAVISW
ncbi:ABC transporter ATP-binding protein [Gemella sp. zg-1178]|uniref:ABC transporter ATP-binding protein n=1 Tax=Gemella sp. zg-1178 TaxID=2840372 RepID=UPI001C04A823|nr:ABC transporter ATP-binding protein [Gemella sp. zg-1178]MBU0279273.1 ABC transporter ATP-binding protein [Gemella sp. zg-1178]